MAAGGSKSAVTSPMGHILIIHHVTTPHLAPVPCNIERKGMTVISIGDPIM